MNARECVKIKSQTDSSIIYTVSGLTDTAFDVEFTLTKEGLTVPEITFSNSAAELDAPNWAELFSESEDAYLNSRLVDVHTPEDACSICYNIARCYESLETAIDDYDEFKYRVDELLEDLESLVVSSEELVQEVAIKYMSVDYTELLKDFVSMENISTSEIAYNRAEILEVLFSMAEDFFTFVDSNKDF